MTQSYEPSEDDKMLRKRLDQWRWEMADEIFGVLFTNDFGCYTFMPNEILDRICDAARRHLIVSIDALEEETCWHLSKEYGQSVIDIISEMQPATTLQPPPQTTTPATAATPGMKPREQTCSSCGQPGHNKYTRQCPNYQSYLVEQVRNGGKTSLHPTNATENETLFAVGNPVDSEPLDLTGKFSQISLA